MAKLYYKLIIQGLWTIERVPTRYKKDVQALLDADEDYQATLKK